MQVWQSQFEANDFPPVCAMTGAPAEVWRAYKFKSTPLWAGVPGVVAPMLGAAAVAAFSTRTSGHLPLTRQAAKRIQRTWLAFFGVIPLAVIVWSLAALIGAPSAVAAAISAVLVLLGFLLLAGGIVAAFVMRNSFGPRGKVMQSGERRELLIELQHVHPAFVAAVQQLQEVRSASAGSSSPPEAFSS